MNDYFIVAGCLIIWTQNVTEGKALALKFMEFVCHCNGNELRIFFILPKTWKDLGRPAGRNKGSFLLRTLELDRRSS